MGLRLSALGILLLVLVACSDHEQARKKLLSDSPSPYLQQSTASPIHWFPWANETVALAKNQDKLIFLNIGFSTCYACKEFAKQTLNTEAIIETLNKNFINIRLDGKVEYALTQFMQNYQTLLMGVAGWPINVILTPDFKPVYVVSPLKASNLQAILKKVTKAWTSERTQMLSEIDDFLSRTETQASEPEFFEKNESLMDRFYALYTHQFDGSYGGLKLTARNRVKFPQFSDHRLLLAHYQKTNTAQTLKMVEKSAQSILLSPTFDHIDGGVYRYSNSRDWNQPVLEKQIADQALLLEFLLDLRTIAPEDIYRIAIEKTIKFILNKMKSPYGGFYDLVSLHNHGLVSADHINQALSSIEQQRLRQVYQLRSLRGMPGKKILRRHTKLIRPNEDELTPVLRKLRPTQGHVEELVITSHSAQVFSALARVARGLKDPHFLESLTNEFDSFIRQLRSLNGTFYHGHFRGHVLGAGDLYDYAMIIDSCIEFYQLTFQSKYLNLAHDLQVLQNRLFFSPTRKAYRLSNTQKPMDLSQQFIHLGFQTPSAQAKSYENLIRLDSYFKKNDWQQMAIDIIDNYPEVLKLNPTQFSDILLGHLFKRAGQNTIIFNNQNPVDCQKEAFAKNFTGTNTTILGCSGTAPAQLKKRIAGLKGETFYCNDSVCSSRALQAQ